MKNISREGLATLLLVVALILTGCGGGGGTGGDLAEYVLSISIQLDGGNGDRDDTQLTVGSSAVTVANGEAQVTVPSGAVRVIAQLDGYETYDQYVSVTYNRSLPITLTATNIGSTTRLVPSQYGTIQAAIVASQDGDVVIVSPGVYPERVNFLGKDIAVRSTDPTDEEVVTTTIIEGIDNGPIVEFIDGETRDAVLSGFTLRDSKKTIYDQWKGSGIRVLDAAPTITYNIIKDNEYTGIIVGGSSSPLIKNNLLEGNGEAGIFLTGEDVTGQVEDNIISNNTKYGMRISSAVPLVQDNLISDNGDSGIFVEHRFSSEPGVPQIIGNIIRENKANFYGGGLYIVDISPLIQNNTITYNEAATPGAQSPSSGGGAIYLENSDAQILDNEISYNRVNGVYYGYAGAIYLTNSNPVIANNEIVGNSANYCGAIIVYENSSPTIYDNNITNNSATYYAGGIYIVNTDGSQVLYQNGSPWTTENCPPGSTQGNTFAGNTHNSVSTGANILFYSILPTPE